jgi:hypothetical protein
VFAKALAKHLGANVLQRGLIVRDSSGRLRFLSADAPPASESRIGIEKLIADALGAYARPDGVISFRDDPGVQRLLNDSAAIPIREDLLSFRLLDRRIVGSAWLDAPKGGAAGPPRIVFASLKGGVGRSTALALAAADLSRRNRNILVIDLDLEAPGIGDMLLDGERIPRFGTIDYLVENGLGGIPDRYLPDFIGTSPLTSPSGGRVDVLPALGRDAFEHPSNTLPKLSRALIEDIDADGSSIPLTVQVAEMIRRFTERGSYDVVLIDTRAGLSEIAAPAILGLGATILLFGTAQRQTIHGYAALFAALKLLADRDSAAGKLGEWRLLFKAVYAKAGLDESVGDRYRDDLYDIFADNIYEVDDIQQTNPDAVSFDIDDTSAPHWPLIIPFTQNFVDFDPVRAPSQLNAAFYEQAYRPFLDGLDSLIGSSGVSLDDPEKRR